MKHFALLALAFVVAGCAVTSEQNEVPITATFAVGDPCKNPGALYDTPPGFPRVCLNGKWVPAKETGVCHQTGKVKKYRHK